jgi:hypothetical protein
VEKAWNGVKKLLMKRLNITGDVPGVDTEERI